MAPVVLSFGGGTNSVAILVEAVARGLPIDAILFADTGGEMPETYRYLESLGGWLVLNGLPPVEVVRATTPRGVEFDGPYTLEDDCLRLQNLPSRAYGSGSCSDRFKQRPVWAEIKRRGWSAGILLRGIDADEAHRARAEDYRPGWASSFPLIDWGMGREECVESIVSAGLPLPGKSACFYCPSAGVAEVAALAKSHPDLFARGLAIEEAARAKRGPNAFKAALKGLGQGFAWRDVAYAAEHQTAMPIGRAAPGACGCYDGARDADRLLAPDYCGSFESRVVPDPRGDGWPLARDWRGTTGPRWSQESLFG